MEKHFFFDYHPAGQHRKGKIVPEQDNQDDAILELAQQIKIDRGISLVEAMDIAAIKLRSGGKEVDCVFNLRLELKPRVAKFFRDNFAGHPTLNVEERLALFLTMHLNRMRGEALAKSRAEADIQEGQANTLRRSTFLARTAG